MYEENPKLSVPSPSPTRSPSNEINITELKTVLRLVKVLKREIAIAKPREKPLEKKY